MNKINSVTDCLNLIDTSIVKTPYFISIEQLEDVHNFLINMSEMKIIENMLVILDVLKYINCMIDEYESLDVEKYRALRKLIIDIMIEIYNEGDIDEWNIDIKRNPIIYHNFTISISRRLQQI